MRFKIGFYHGYSKRHAETLEERTHYFQDQTCLEKLAPETYSWIGSLDLFYEQYGDSFMIRGDTIWITPHSSWGAR